MEKMLMDAEMKNVAEALEKQKKVRVRIPLNPLNPDDVEVPVCVNGYRMVFRRGEAVEVSETVEEILAGAGYI